MYSIPECLAMAAAMPNHFKISNPMLAMGESASPSTNRDESEPLDQLQSHFPAQRVENLDELPPEVARIAKLHQAEQRKKK